VTFMNVSLSAPVARATGTTTGSLGVVGARFILDGRPSEGRFSLVEHPIVARGMAAPVHLQVDPDGTARIAAEHRLVTALPE
jgi:hypothetical protein